MEGYKDNGTPDFAAAPIPLPMPNWVKGAGVACAAAVLASLLSFHQSDPSFMNLRAPLDGVANWLWLPGALVGGSLVEFFGASALWIPVLMLNWVLLPVEGRGPFRYAVYAWTVVLASAALHGMAGGEPGEGLAAPGLAGLAGAIWAYETLGVRAGGLILVGGVLFALAKLVRSEALDSWWAAIPERLAGLAALAWGRAADWRARLRPSLPVTASGELEPPREAPTHAETLAATLGMAHAAGRQGRGPASTKQVEPPGDTAGPRRWPRWGSALSFARKKPDSFDTWMSRLNDDTAD